MARFATPSGTRKVPIQFFAASHKDATRIAKRKAGKGLLFGLTLAGVEAFPDESTPRDGAKKAA